jgi:hypothetical protein
MANGGWYGTAEEWQRLEGPLLTIDPVLELFSARHDIELLKNEKDAPGRAFRWGDNPNFLIQVFLADEGPLTWNLWLCCVEDRDDSRYWLNGYAVRAQPIESFGSELDTLLEEGFARLTAWGSNPEQLEFATKLAPMPRF